jgi:tripartite-type tricarboxylate transporter receptor subunit TctC
MPDVPTLKEEGINIVVHTWWGILAPTGTPKPIIDKLVVELNSVIRLPDVNRTLTETLGMDVVALNPAATQKWIEDNVARWAKVVRDNNIRAD